MVERSMMSVLGEMLFVMYVSCNHMVLLIDSIESTHFESLQNCHIANDGIV